MEEELHKTVKKQMVDLGLDARGAKKALAREIGVSQSSLSMALSGYRSGQASAKILRDLQTLLDMRGGGDQSRESKGLTGNMRVGTR